MDIRKISKSSMMKNKRGQLNMLLEFILFIAVAVILSVLVFEVTDDSRDDLTENSTAWNATYDADEALAKIPKNLKLLATAVIFGAVLFVILRVIPRFTGGGAVGGF